MAEAELVALFEKASTAADRAVSTDNVVLAAEEARCNDALKTMGSLEVSTALLLSTQVGKRLRKLTKHQSSLISSSAQRLLDEWKKVVADEAASKSGSPKEESTPKPGTPARTQPVVLKTETVREMKVYTSKSSKQEMKNVVSSSSKPSTPKVETKRVVSSSKVESKHVSPSPKIGVSKYASGSPKVESKNAVRPAPQPVAGRTTTGSPLSTSANSSANAFEPKIGKLPKAGGDATRDKLRELLLESFKKCCHEVTDEHLEQAKKVDFVKVVVAVESALFAKLGLSKDGEKAKYRSIMFNMKDNNNPDFRRRVLLGEIKPEEIVNMTADDMASDARKKENETIREKALFECERGLQNVASTDQFRCGKCGQRKTTYFQLQTRSADEPMTTFVTCVNCNARWKFC